MKRLLFAALAGALLVPIAAAAAPTDTVTAQILAANDAVQAATVKHDAATLAKVVTDDYHLTSATGQFYDRAAFLADTADPTLIYDLNQTESPQVQLYGDNTAVLTAILHIKFHTTANPKGYDVRVRITDTWVKIDGTWRYAAGQGTLLKPGQT